MCIMFILDDIMDLFLFYLSIFSIITLNLFPPFKTFNSLETKAKFERLPTFSYSRSVRGLQDLISADLQIAQALSQNLHNFRNDSHFRKASEQYLEDLYSGNGLNVAKWNNFTKAQQAEVEGIAKNPIASYRTIRRMVTLLPDLFWRTTGLEKITTAYLHRGQPSQKDLNQAMDGILSLNLVYDFDIEAFSNGNISGALIDAKLDAVHCHEIGLYGMDKGGFQSQVIDWLELALNKVTLQGDTTIDKGVIFTNIWKAAKAHDEALTKDLSYESYFYLFNTSIEHLMETGDISKRSKRRAPTNAVGPGPSIYLKEEKDALTYHTMDYFNLCRGANFQPLEKKSKLFCWLEYKAHHRFLIGPMKMEFLAMEPDLVQIYDVVSEKIIQKLKDVSADTMVLAKVVDDGVMEEFEFEGRKSESSWLDPEVYASDFESLKLIISQLTNLDTVKIDSSESLQIASYTFSGHYIPHLDATQKPDEKGLRIGTFMIYLSDVEIGGFTAFPHLGVAAKPIKGSAVFWHNILRSEQIDYLTLHGACPVIVGHKYVANEWIRYYNQFLTHKCSNDPLERFQVFVNKNSHIIS